jgi:hypothetical protein
MTKIAVTDYANPFLFGRIECEVLSSLSVGCCIRGRGLTRRVTNNRERKRDQYERHRGARYIPR